MMTIFELMLYACVTTAYGDIGSIAVGRYSKTCEWHSSGRLFAAQDKCEAEGKLQIGATIMGDTIYVNATNKYEETRCVERAVQP